MSGSIDLGGLSVGRSDVLALDVGQSVPPAIFRLGSALGLPESANLIGLTLLQGDFVGVVLDSVVMLGGNGFIAGDVLSIAGDGAATLLAPRSELFVEETVRPNALHAEPSVNIFSNGFE